MNDRVMRQEQAGCHQGQQGGSERGFDSKGSHGFLEPPDLLSGQGTPSILRLRRVEGEMPRMTICMIQCKP